MKRTEHRAHAIENTPRALLLALLVVLALAPAAHAQINGPTPTLQGQRSYHLYSVPGVIASLSLHTFFGCTNMTSANIRVGVELFSAVGGLAANDPSVSSLDINPGGTALFGTSTAVGISISSNVGGFFTKGSARILATKPSGIICTAFVADQGNAPPTSAWQLTIIKNKTQKGD